MRMPDCDVKFECIILYAPSKPLYTYMWTKPKDFRIIRRPTIKALRKGYRDINYSLVYLGILLRSIL